MRMSDTIVQPNIANEWWNCQLDIISRTKVYILVGCGMVISIHYGYQEQLHFIICNDIVINQLLWHKWSLNTTYYGIND